MIDIHCHILPNIDDGSKNIDESLDMCKIALQNNISDIVATPHFLSFYEAERFFQMRNDKLEQLQQAIKNNKFNINILPGAEVACSDAMFRYTNLNKLTINNSRYLLLEFPFIPVKEEHLMEYTDCVFDNGLIPIIAHPERFEIIINNYDIINELGDKGCLFQINCFSLLGGFGRRVKKLAMAMLKNGYADILATDAHTSSGRRSINLKEMVNSIPDSIQSEILSKAVNDIPLLIINNKPIQIIRQSYIKKSIF